MMGFQKKDVKIDALGITVPEAYAQITQLSVGLDRTCSACFKIQTARDNMDKPALENRFVRLMVDKSRPLHKQAYECAKNDIFSDWEDDIPEESSEV